MWLVYGISIIVAELFHNPGNLFMLSSEDSIANDFLEPVEEVACERCVSKCVPQALFRAVKLRLTYSRAPCFRLS